MRYSWHATSKPGLMVLRNERQETVAAVNPRAGVTLAFMVAYKAGTVTFSELPGVQFALLGAYASPNSAVEAVRKQLEERGKYGRYPDLVLAN